jgi:2-haloacid dehalogenase
VENRIRALLFDVFGTVVDWRGGVARDVAQVAPSVDAAAFAAAWRAGYQPAMDQVRRHELPWTKLDGLHRRILDGLLADFELPALSEAEKEWLNTCWHRLDPWPDAVEGLRRMKQRFTVATLSNGNISLLVDMAKRAGIPWDCVFSAELFGHYKPDLETYLGAVELLSLTPPEVMLVAAHNSDLSAARQYGLATAFVQRPGEDPEPAGQCTYAAADFTELATLLGT